MALPPSDPARHRRQQRRRALIGWLVGGLLLALFVLAAILGGDEEKHQPGPQPLHSAGFFDYHMTSGQYAGLHTGEKESAVLIRLGKVGLPESETDIVFVQLFPPHDESVECSYWAIIDAFATVARLCFSSPEGVLLQKLERDLAGEFEGAPSVSA
jgi:hypothetical protein